LRFTGRFLWQAFVLLLEFLYSELEPDINVLLKLVLPTKHGEVQFVFVPEADPFRAFAFGVRGRPSGSEPVPTDYP